MKHETIGYSTLYLADCMDLLATLPDKSIDLCICDPPYGGSCNANTNDDIKVHRGDYGWGKCERTGGGWNKQFGNKIKEWDIAPDENYFNELFRVSKKAIIWGGNYFPLPPSRNYIIYRKRDITENFTMAMCEYAWTNIQGNVKVYERVAPQLDRIHPTQKPVALYKWLLSRYAKQGDRILDTHFGSGSLAVACNELGFNLTACEIDEEYYNSALKRIKEANKQGLLFREAV